MVRDLVIESRPTRGKSLDKFVKWAGFKLEVKE